jgi:hypothetical protein
MLAQFSIGQILLNGVGTNNTVLFVLVRILDDLGALVADLAELANFMTKVRSHVAGQLYLVGKTLVKVMAAERPVFVQLLTHQIK